ncbi:hypothetical protein MRX96_012989 [Rhipicephalus microplus]
MIRPIHLHGRASFCSTASSYSCYAALSLTHNRIFVTPFRHFRQRRWRAFSRRLSPRAARKTLPGAPPQSRSKLASRRYVCDHLVPADFGGAALIRAPLRHLGCDSERRR